MYFPSYMLKEENIVARPFLKWAGGKTQLIPSLQSILPQHLHGTNFTYLEPFIGSGAVLFWFLRSFPNIKTAIINDVNKDLTVAYTTIKLNPKELVKELIKIEKQYHHLEPKDQKVFYLDQRELFNSRKYNSIKQTALLIFLNRTCYNGLYRVNSNNQFNVPFGRYTNPSICDEQNIYNVSRALQKVTILQGDYSATLSMVKGNAFYYLDPPYKPLSSTAVFNSYAKDSFDDLEQKRLKLFCDELNNRNIQWLLSNSDPKNTNPDNDFFDDLYAQYNIKRVKAKRRINSDASKRGEIYELLIHNYELKNASILI